MDATLPIAQALAVKEGRIVEVGGSDEILWLREGEYELIDPLLRARRAGGPPRERVTCHAIGNRGVETAVEAIAEARAREPDGRGRARIDHSSSASRRPGCSGSACTGARAFLDVHLADVIHVGGPVRTPTSSPAEVSWRK
jgi:hypothetical protein